MKKTVLLGHVNVKLLLTYMIVQHKITEKSPSLCKVSLQSRNYVCLTLTIGITLTLNFINYTHRYMYIAIYVATELAIFNLLLVMMTYNQEQSL